MAEKPKQKSSPEAASVTEIADSAVNGSTGSSGTAGYHVELPGFEGPLDLLLHLIQEHKLDIMNIPIGFVTEKYVEYIELFQDLNIDVASEYLVMAATLAHIKSRMLLPTPPEDDEEDAENEGDPRAELVRRLLEYQKYKLAGEELSQRQVLGRDIFLRGAPAPTVEGPAPLASIGLFKLLDAFQAVLTRAKRTTEHEIDFDRISISDKINALSDLLRGRERVHFEELFDDQQSRAELIVTFLALLEMTRLRMTRLIQEGPLEPILIELSVSADGTDGLFSAAELDVSAEGLATDPDEPDLESDESDDFTDEPTIRTTDGE